MAEELEELWKKLTFTEAKDEGIELGSNSTRAAKEIGKNCMVMKDFEGKLVPKEIKLKWVPFWVQIFNLPLKCMTRESGFEIGSKIGAIIDVDVPEKGVQ
ncbi:hypothetical protein SO802_005938 [Lithocarpus litseifolius]|uniref:DUF4283 domain-containing protein n=1 Tax=Lithocarpus litseifolius TaxID=425828 RepID=A0AAW2DJJ0_9ROSI